jgi:hypothetical protein
LFFNIGRHILRPASPRRNPYPVHRRHRTALGSAKIIAGSFLQTEAEVRGSAAEQPLSRLFLIQRPCVRWTHGVTPASFALIQRLNQFLNQRTHLRGVALIRNSNTELTPIPLHAISHVDLRYSGANAAFVWSMFDATTLSGSVDYGFQPVRVVLIMVVEQFCATGFTVLSGW